MRTHHRPATSAVRVAFTSSWALALATSWLVIVEPACSSDQAKIPGGAAGATLGGAAGGSSAAPAGGNSQTGGNSGNSTGANAPTGGNSGSSTGGNAPTGGSSGGNPQTGGNSGNTGGAAGAAAGSSNAGVGGGDASVAATGCSGKTYKLCEDFETGTVGALGPMWTKLNGYGTAGPSDVALASDAAHSGKLALKSDSINRGQQRAQRSLTSLGATAYKHWGRIFYKVEQPSPAPQQTATNTVIHITWTSLIGPGGENRVVDVVENMAGAHQWLFNIPSDGCCTSSAYNWKFDDAWHCSEWWVDVAANSYRFFSDSTEVTALAFTGKTNSTMSNYASIAVGATWYQQAGTILSPFVIWFDDLAIDDNRIGCE